jgi:hypothetical protein
METKACTKCKTTKPLDDFKRDIRYRDGRKSWCLSCEKEYRKQYYADNKETIARQVTEWKSTHEKFIRDYTAAWRAKNIVKVREYSRKGSAKIRGTARGHLNDCISSAINSSLRKGIKAGRSWELLLGYTVDQLKRHMEKQFSPGMTWENYGKHWEIDHNLPVSAFNFEKPEDLDFRRCWALKNLRPLEKFENRCKHDKVDRPLQPSLAISA